MIQKTLLPNGVRVVTEHIPLSHVISLGVWITAGSRDEAASQEGITHLLEHMLFKGTERRSAREIARELDALGGYSNAFTTKEHLCLYGKVLDQHLPRLLDVFTDILLASTFDSQELERERHVIVQEINMLEDSPEDYVHTLFCEKFWSEHPLGHPICGYRDTVLNVDRATLMRFKDSIIHPSQLLITAAGNVEHDHFVSLITPTLGTLVPNGRGRPERTVPQRCTFCEFVPKKLEQVHLCIGTQGVALRDEARFLFYILNMVLGNSMSSRLFQEVREKRGLAYSIYSFLNSYEDGGLFGIYAAAEISKIREVATVIKEEMERMFSDGITEGELLRAKDCFVGSLYLNMDGSDAFMNRIAKNEIVHGRQIPPEEVEQRIFSISRDSFMHWLASSGRHLFRDVSVLLLGPLKQRDFEQVRAVFT